ncbi:putative nucleotide-binding protein with TIR-like domain [Mucilaginibacter gracilis]|uniref:Putative nucleotide-binding protein with TIR-like domain n=1 Tax=Mucilaginibacter gracilis TaxID=423350 RepID=A0A495J6F8_9SPHI|nr:TIR domain-containing protein [Mucilaginibacter gracilis]RKR84202.1 putative nucleotide-binding protein with TIR-like domain [Mucilaginibacter gracilis]
MIQSNNIDRGSADYLSLLFDRLTFNNLVSNALKIENDPNYEKVIRIDFCGISGSTLLGPEGEEQDKIHTHFLELFDKIDILEKIKIKLQIRFIFLYVYSDFAFAQIEAERTQYRATIKDPKYDSRHLDLSILSAGDIESSSIYMHQTHALRKIQEIHNRHFSKNKSKSPITNIRFTCLPLNFCLLTINNETFTDPYTYAKERINSSSLYYKTPLSYVENDSKHFSVLEDHFRYIWNHPTTMVYEDATEADSKRSDGGRIQNLDKIKRPDKVNFEIKAKILRTELNASAKDVNKWRVRVEQMFANMVRFVRPTNDEEVVFIGFSWNNGRGFALKIQKFIEHDFQGWLKVNIVDLADAKEPLYSELIGKMNSSTIGLIIFTKDITIKEEGGSKSYSRPNLYFEFGYLKKHLEKYEPYSDYSRTLIMSENNYSVATDLQDLGRFTLTKKIEIDYYQLLRRFILLHRTLTDEMAIYAVNSYISRLEEAYHKGTISNKDFRGKSYEHYINEIKEEMNKIIEKKYGNSTSVF